MTSRDDEDRELFADAADESDSGWDDLEARAAEEAARRADDGDQTPGAPAPGGRSARAGRIAGRAATGLIGTGIAAVVIAGLSVLQLPRIDPPVNSVLIEPTALGREVVCPGSATRLGNDPVAAELALTALGPVQRGVAGTGWRSQSLAPAGVGGAGSPPEAYRVEERAGAALAAAQSQRVAAGRLRGFLATGCAAPLHEQWLVGGSTAVGRTSLVHLANPGVTTATVTLRVYGAEGPAGESPGIVIAPGTERIVSLAAFARSLDAPVVQVESAGAAVAAQLFATVERSLDPGGADLFAAVPTPLPGAAQRILGVRIDGAEAIAAASQTGGLQDLAPVLRLFPVADAPLETSILIEGLAGSAAEGVRAESVETLQPGQVLEVPLSSLADGDYAITVRAEQPVLAAARVSQRIGTGSELGWYQASAPLAGQEAFVVAEGAPARLVLAGGDHAGGEGPVEAVLTGPSGSVAVAVPAAGAIVLPAAPGAWTITGPPGIAAAVVYAGPGQLAAHPVVPRDPAPASVTVHF